MSTCHIFVQLWTNSTTAGVIHVNCRWNYSFFNQLLGVNYVLRALWQTVLIPWTIHPPCSPNSSKIESGRETAIGTGNAQHIGRVSTHRKASLWAAKLKRWGWTGASHGGGKRRSPHRSRWLQAHVSHVNAKPQITAFSAGDPGSVPGSERSPGGGNGNPLQYSCLENSMDRGVQGVKKSRDTTEQLTLSFIFTFPDT